MARPGPLRAAPAMRARSRADTSRHTRWSCCWAYWGRSAGRWWDKAMNGLPILSLMLLVPLVGAIGCLVLDAKAARAIALVATLVDLALGLVLWANYDIGGAQWQFTERVQLFAGFSWALGIDGIALMLIM